MNFFGNNTDETLTGSAGDDYLDGGAGNDTIDGGADGPYGDIVGFGSATTGVNVNLEAGVIGNDGTGGVDAIVNVEHVNGTPFDDTLVGNAFNNGFQPGAGNDYVDGGAGSGDHVKYDDATAAVTVNLLTGQASGASIGNDTLVGIEGVHGSAFDDVITLRGGYVLGLGGNDLLKGDSGDEFFIGGSGNDTINGASGYDTANYEDTYDPADQVAPIAGVTVNLATGIATDNWGDTDTLTSIEYVFGSPYADHLIGGNPANGSGATDGFEGFRGNGGDDTIDGGAGYDRVYYDRAPTGVNVTLGGTSNGTAQDGLGGTDTLINIEDARGSSFNDTLTGSDSGVYESFDGRAGNDIIDGKGGTDRVDYQGSPGGVVVNLLTGTASDGWGGTDSLANIEIVRGSGFNDYISGGANNNDLVGLAGNDTLLGGDGQDTLTGGAGNDLLDGGAQRIADGANFSSQYDFANYSDATSGINVSLGADGTNGTATGGGVGTDTLVNIEWVLGSIYGDVIRGSNRAVTEVIRGGAGNDTLYGGDVSGVDLGENSIDYSRAAGAVNVNLATGKASGADGNDVFSGFQSISSGSFDDQLTGDAQDNAFIAGAGNDTINGGAGRDMLSFQVATGGVTASLATGTSSGADGNDSFINIENLRGSEFADMLSGDAGNNRIQGRDGGDAIDGGAGDDSLHGGYGNDTLTGGAGNDTFQYSGGGEGVDRITDFVAGDVIAIAVALTAGMPVSGTGTGVLAGGVQISQAAGLTTLYIGTDNVAGADITIELAGAFNASGFNVSTTNGISSIIYSAVTPGVAIIGTATQGQTLTLSLENFGGLGAISYQWMAGGTHIDGATSSTYTLTQAEVGKVITVQASYTDGYGSPESTISAATTVVANVNDLPTGAVTITGTLAQGQTLTAANTLADPDGLGAISYQWRSGGIAIDGATSNTLLLEEAQVGKSMTVTASYIGGFSAIEAVTSAASAAVLPPPNPITGTSDNDRQVSTSGNDVIDGGAGIDTAAYASLASEYSITINRSSGTATVSDTQGGRDGSDTLVNIERIEFSDMTLNLTVQDRAENIPVAALNRVTELYVAFFNRIPDADGMAFWIGAYEAGTSLNDIAGSFYNAGVYFSELTGYQADMSNADFVNIVYRNVLGRSEGADQEGLAFWTTALAQGTASKGTLVSSILDAAHGEVFSDPANTYHWVQKLLDNKLDVAKQVALTWGVNYNTSEDSITKGMAIAAAVTPDGIDEAIQLVGISPDMLNFI